MLSFTQALHAAAMSARLGLPRAHSFNAVISKKGPGTGGQTAHAPAGESDGGQFISGPGGAGGGSLLRDTITRDAQRMTAEGKALPVHIAELKIPPAWTHVRINHDPEANLLAQGKDAKGRVVSIYNKTFSAAKQQEKFARVHELNEKFDAVHAQNEALRGSNSPRVADAADTTALIMHTGIRPGSEADTGAKVKAYGATTLLGSHVVTGADGKVSLQYTGKKGVALNIPVHDAGLASMLQSRAASAGATGQLFKTSDSSLLDHVHSLDGGGFKTKDFRTLVGTRTAMSAIDGMAVPRTEAEYQRSVMAVAKIVSTKLGNTPTVALQSYINPVVFGSWRHARGASA